MCYKMIAGKNSDTVFFSLTQTSINILNPFTPEPLVTTHMDPFMSQFILTVINNFDIFNLCREGEKKIFNNTCTWMNTIESNKPDKSRPENSSENPVPLTTSSFKLILRSKNWMTIRRQNSVKLINILLSKTSYCCAPILPCLPPFPKHNDEHKDSKN